MLCRMGESENRSAIQDVKCPLGGPPTLEYRINRGVRIIGGSEMVRYNNNQGVGIIRGCLEK